MPLKVIAFEDGTYDEIHIPSEYGTSPDFPDTCPACGAKEVERKMGWLGHNKYACGGGFKIKPQIQNHTDKWWGRCGKALDKSK